MTNYTFRLPTLDRLGASVPADLGVKSVTSGWFQLFSNAVESRNVDAIMQLFVGDALWRDILTLTWDFRTFDGSTQIRTFLEDRLAVSGMSRIQLGNYVILQKPFPDLAWIVAMFEFETAVGVGSGVARLVPTADGQWKGVCMFTNLEGLKNFPERIGSLRDGKVRDGLTWAQERYREMAFENTNPVVLIIGGGHCGLTLAARLKYLDIPTLVVEAHDRIGDSWRVRYDSLCLHWPVWFDHMPYIPFPPTWPKYMPSWKMADWLEFYAKSLDLNVWTSSTVTQADKVDGCDHQWKVTVRRLDGSERVFEVRHLVFATGVGGGYPKIPHVKGKDIFKGRILHSFQYKSAKNHIGEKVLVVGSGNSGHDIAADLARHGVDVTMFQRSPTFVMNLDKQWKYLGGALYSENSMPTEMADRLFASMPHLLQEGGLAQRQTKAIMAGDKDLLDRLTRAGFKLNSGIKDAGILLLLKTKGGGHYFDVGASELIISGKIKLKNDTDRISTLTPTGVQFGDDSELPFDTIVFATGVGRAIEPIREICGAEVASQCKPLGGLDASGEFRGMWRDVGVPGLWYMNGPLQMSRIHSKPLALQIKAIEGGVFGERYSLDIN